MLHPRCLCNLCNLNNWHVICSTSRTTRIWTLRSICICILLISTTIALCGEKVSSGEEEAGLTNLWWRDPICLLLDLSYPHFNLDFLHICLPFNFHVNVGGPLVHRSVSSQQIITLPLFLPNFLMFSRLELFDWFDLSDENNNSIFDLSLLLYMRQRWANTVFWTKYEYE